MALWHIVAPASKGVAMSDLSRSRRDFLKSSAGLAAGAAVPLVPRDALAQTAGAELARIQRAKRILLKGGIVLTLDRTIGGFAAGDIPIADGMRRHIRPHIAST